MHLFPVAENNKVIPSLKKSVHLMWTQYETEFLIYKSIHCHEFTGIESPNNSLSVHAISVSKCVFAWLPMPCNVQVMLWAAAYNIYGMHCMIDNDYSVTD